MEGINTDYVLEDLPQQKLPKKRKGKKWGKSCIDELEHIVTQVIMEDLPDIENKLIMIYTMVY